MLIRADDQSRHRMLISSSIMGVVAFESGGEYSVVHACFVVCMVGAFYSYMIMNSRYKAYPCVAYTTLVLASVAMLLWFITAFMYYTYCGSVLNMAHCDFAASLCEIYMFMCVGVWLMGKSRPPTLQEAIQCDQPRICKL